MQPVNGISIYPNLLPLEETIQYIQQAGQHHFEYVFSSLHIPEWSLDEQLDFVSQIVDVIHSYPMKLVVDMRGSLVQHMMHEPEYASRFQALQLDGIRVDFEINSEVLAMIKQIGIDCIFINASILNSDEINHYYQLSQSLGLQVIACHNYYPRPETGLSAEFYLQQKALFDARNIDTIAFIPSHEHPRGPIYSGLPTLEHHRYLSLEQAVLDLRENLHTSHIFIGDGHASELELQQLQRICHDRIISLKIELLDTQYDDLLFSNVHTIRYDSGLYQLRIEGTRQMASHSQLTIPPHNTVARNRGAITFDNERYLRYEGELQIIKQDLPADSRVNVIGHVADEDLWKLSYLSSDYQVQFVK